MYYAAGFFNPSRAKKKSSNYIIPASFFKSTTVQTPVVDNPKPAIQQTTKQVKVSSQTINPVSRRRKQSALSLKKIQNRLTDKDVISVDEDLSNKPKDVFSQEDLEEKWTQFGKQLQQEGQTNMASIINASKPILQGDKIIYALPTKLMEEQFFSERPQLLKFLRASLNNYAFKIETKVLVTEKKKYIYSPQEKFQKLVEINPNVLTLKNTFGLDF